MGGLGRLLVEEWETLEADFAQFYPSVEALPLAVFGPNPISARRLRVLIKHLPFESRLVRKRRDWHPDLPTPAERLILDLGALTLESVSAGNLLFLKAHSRPGTVIPDPVKIPRVWRDTDEDEPRTSTVEELASFMGRRGIVRYTPPEETST